jgi:TetR/AcrR family tetracycline transcriptional repressor
MTGSARRGSRPRRVPTEAEILDAALALLDAGGPGAASIKRIAAAVDAAPNTVYTYFPDHAAVVRALVERLLGDVGHATRDRVDRPWRENVEALAVGLRSCLIAHPGAAPLMVGAPFDGPNALLLRERLLGLLADAGLDAVGAARAAYVVMVYVLGSVLLEAGDAPHIGSLPPEAARIAARRERSTAIPADAFPRTAAAAEVIATWIGTEQYLWGLRRVLSGLVDAQLK